MGNINYRPDRYKKLMIATRHLWSSSSTAHRINIDPPEDKGPNGESWVLLHTQADGDAVVVCWWTMTIKKPADHD